jgi:hypothetical protein
MLRNVISTLVVSFALSGSVRAGDVNGTGRLSRHALTGTGYTKMTCITMAMLQVVASDQPG